MTSPAGLFKQSIIAFTIALVGCGSPSMTPSNTSGVGGGSEGNVGSGGAIGGSGGTPQSAADAGSGGAQSSPGDDGQDAGNAGVGGASDSGQGGARDDGTGTGGSDGGTSSDSGSAGGPNQGWDRFFIRNKSGMDGSVAVDSQGGIHFVYLAGNEVRYAYCSSQCDVASNWPAAAAVIVGADRTGTNRTALALDPQGHPRVMTETVTSYNYSECNTNCNLAGSWTTVSLAASNGAGLPDYQEHFFDVDSNGAPAFIFNYFYDNSLVYASCSSGCTNVTNWKLNKNIKLYSTSVYAFRFFLTHDNKGGRRLAYLASGSTYALGYAACDISCEIGSNWHSNLPVAILGSTAPQISIALAMTSMGKPRLSVSTSDTSGIGANALPSNAVLYSACDDPDCSAPTANWPVSLIPAASADSLTMVLDAQDSPHVALHSSANSRVAYRVCTSQCTSPAPSWAVTFVPDSNMDKAYPIPTANGCTASGWVHLPSDRLSLALDPAGNAILTLDGEHGQTGGSCTCDPSTMPYCSMTDAYGVYMRELLAM